VKKKLKSFSKVKLFSISFNFRFAAADESISSHYYSQKLKGGKCQWNLNTAAHHRIVEEENEPNKG